MDLLISLNASLKSAFSSVAAAFAGATRGSPPKAIPSREQCRCKASECKSTRSRQEIHESGTPRQGGRGSWRGSIYRKSITASCPNECQIGDHRAGGRFGSVAASGFGAGGLTGFLRRRSRRARRPAVKSSTHPVRKAMNPHPLRNTRLHHDRTT